MSDEKPSLEDVYSQYNVTGGQRQPEQSAEQQTVASPAGGSEVTAAIAALAEDMKSLRQDNESLRQEAIRSQEKADLQNVLEKLGTKLEGVKTPHIKYALAERYETDGKFKEVWDNRANNPDAFNAALDALAPILQEELAVRADPKIAEDQQAFDNALQSAETTATDARDDEVKEWMKLNPAAFEARWRQLMASG